MQNSVFPYITIGIFIFILAMLYGMWDHGSPWMARTFKMLLVIYLIYICVQLELT